MDSNEVTKLANALERSAAVIAKALDGIDMNPGRSRADWIANAAVQIVAGAVSFHEPEDALGAKTVAERAISVAEEIWDSLLKR